MDAGLQCVKVQTLGKNSAKLHGTAGLSLTPRQNVPTDFSNEIRADFEIIVIFSGRRREFSEIIWVRAQIRMQICLRFKIAGIFFSFGLAVFYSSMWWIASRRRWKQQTALEC